jgi:hypothetical protein
VSSSNTEVANVQREQLQREYELLQKKIDTHSTFKFLVRGWSFTATGAAAIALGSKDIVFWQAAALVVGLAGAALVFHVMATEQALLVRALGLRALRVERELGRLWPGRAAKEPPASGPSDTADDAPVAETSPALGRAMTARRYSASEIVLATFLTVGGLSLLRRPRTSTDTSRVRRVGRSLVRHYASLVLHLGWAIAALRSQSGAGTFSEWSKPRFRRLKRARDNLHLFWAQVAILFLALVAIAWSDHGTKPPKGVEHTASAPKAAVAAADGSAADGSGILVDARDAGTDGHTDGGSELVLPHSGAHDRTNTVRPLRSAIHRPPKKPHKRMPGSP